MRHLFFQEILILSKTEKKAIQVNLGSPKTLITGKNNVGKSSLIKALYYTLGAGLPKIANSRWQKSNAIYCLKFALGEKIYWLIRDGRYFGLFDAAQKLITKAKGITTEGGIGATIGDMLNFHISLENKDGKFSRLSPSYYFLPFYLDQDSGWSTAWSSFDGLTAIKLYKKTMIEYHLGIRPQSFYNAKAKLASLRKDFSNLSEEKNSLITVRDRYRDRKQNKAIDIDQEKFRAEIDELLKRFNEVQIEKQEALDRVKAAQNKCAQMETEIAVLRRAILELEKDYKFAEDPKQPDHIECPTCGITYENSIAERFEILDDIDYCSSLIDQKKKKLSEFSDELATANNEYNLVADNLSSIEVLLSHKKGDISFHDVIQSEGFKEMMASINMDIKSVDDQQAENETSQKALEGLTSLDKDLKASIISHYQDRMKSFLNELNVSTIQEDDYKNPVNVVTKDATGSDNPRTLLAHHTALLMTMGEFNKFACCPLVIDSPFQQEQDPANSKAIFDFIQSNTLSDQQLIIGTLEENCPPLEESDDLKVIKLENKYSLLQSDQYESVLKIIKPLHDETLRVESF